MQSFSGKHAFVTGGASGLGLGVAKGLVLEGARVTIADINEASLGEAAATAPESLLAVKLDVRDREGWTLAKAEAERRFGPVDILVNNAGIGPDGAHLADVDPDVFDRVIDINLTGVFNGIRAFAADMRARQSGYIVSTASTGGLNTGAGMGPYCASKYAVVAISESLRDELAPHGVQVSVICAGAMASELRRTTASFGSPVSSMVFGEAGDRLTRLGMPPEDAARRVLDGMRANELFIFTHVSPARRKPLTDRWERVISAFDRAEPSDFA